MGLQKIIDYKSVLISFIAVFAIFLLQEASAQQKDQLVRMAKLLIDSSQVNTYQSMLYEEIEASIRVEPGVLTLYAVAEIGKPQHITIFETYANQDAYKTHLETPHFKKYKTGTQAMVKSLELVQMNSIIFRKKNADLIKEKKIIVQIAKLQIAPNQLASYQRILKKGIETAIKKESGVLAFYAVVEKDKPTHIHFRNLR
jgi:quinol monooxygenase YgiN